MVFFTWLILRAVANTNNRPANNNDDNNNDLNLILGLLKKHQRTANRAYADYKACVAIYYLIWITHLYFLSLNFFINFIRIHFKVKLSICTRSDIQILQPRQRYESLIFHVALRKAIESKTIFLKIDLFSIKTFLRIKCPLGRHRVCMYVVMGAVTLEWRYKIDTGEYHRGAMSYSKGGRESGD